MFPLLNADLSNGFDCYFEPLSLCKLPSPVNESLIKLFTGATDMQRDQFVLDEECVLEPQLVKVRPPSTHCDFISISAHNNVCQATLAVPERDGYSSLLARGLERAVLSRSTGSASSLGPPPSHQTVTWTY